jgi:hypothetical protein
MKRAKQIQEDNKKAAEGAVAFLNTQTNAADIIKTLPFMDIDSAVKIINGKPVTWRYLNLFLMQRQVSELLKWQKEKMGIKSPI